MNLQRYRKQIFLRRNNLLNALFPGSSQLPSSSTGVNKNFNATKGEETFSAKQALIQYG